MNNWNENKFRINIRYEVDINCYKYIEILKICRSWKWIPTLRKIYIWPKNFINFMLIDIWNYKYLFFLKKKKKKVLESY